MRHATHQRRMLGRTAGGLTWMSRYIERAENQARLIETGLRMALTRRGEARSEWSAVVTAGGSSATFEQKYGEKFEGEDAIDFLLRDPDNPSSALSSIEAARMNARSVRTAITREVWEAVNECWLDMTQTLREPVPEDELPRVLDRLRRHGALVRGCVIGTMLRNAIFDFTRMGVALERADNTARILDVKYHVLLPRPSDVGGTLDTVQWEQLLFAVHVRRAYLVEYGAEYSPETVAEFLMLNPRMPRSLAFCASTVADHLDHLAREFDHRPAIVDRADALAQRLKTYEIDDVFELGLHEVLVEVIGEIATLTSELSDTYRFTA